MSYPLTYEVTQHDPPLEQDQVPEECGACHDIWIGSIVKGESGGKSYAFISMDGKTGEEVSDKELFQLWVILAGVLADNLEDGVQKQLCTEAFKAVQRIITAGDKLKASAGNGEEKTGD